MKIHKNPDMHLPNHGLAKTTLYREGETSIDIHADLKFFNRMAVWRKAMDSKFICIEPAFVKNGLNDEPILIPKDGVFETKLSISIS